MKNRSDHATFHVVFIHFEPDEKKEAKRRRLKNTCVSSIVVISHIKNNVLNPMKRLGDHKEVHGKSQGGGLEYYVVIVFLVNLCKIKFHQKMILWTITFFRR